MQLPIGLQLLGRGLVGDLLLQARHNLVLQDLEHPGIHCLVEHKERLAIHGIDPVVGGGAQAQLLARHIVARQRGLMAVVHPYMAIDVQHRRLLGVLTHPVSTQLRAPGLCLLLNAKQRDLLAQGTHFRNPVQPQQLAPFARGTVAQLLQRGQPRQGQEGQHQKQALQAVIAFGQLEVVVRLMQQPHRQQRR